MFCGVVSIQELQQFCASSKLMPFKGAPSYVTTSSSPLASGPLNTAHLTVRVEEASGLVVITTQATASSLKAAKQAAARKALLHPTMAPRLKQWRAMLGYLAKPRLPGADPTEADAKMQLLTTLLRESAAAAVAGDG